jgi:hypothetical protein
MPTGMSLPSFTSAATRKPAERRRLTSNWSRRALAHSRARLIWRVSQTRALTVYSVPFTYKRSECGADFGEVGLGICLLCRRPFCQRHLVVRNRVATCAPCRTRRENLTAGSQTRTKSG